MTRSRAAARFAFLVIFFASGFTALLYQTVWHRVLTLFGGADVSSVTIVVAAFMAGLGFGHLAGGHLADRLAPRQRIVAFAGCELAVALFAAGSPTIYYDILYVRFGAVDLSYAVLALVVFLVTLWPTFFMGMSLPLAARAVTEDEGEADAGRWISLLYGWNTLGAACGSFTTAGVLFRAIDFPGTLRIGAVLSLAGGLAALLLSSALLRSGAERRGNDERTRGEEPRPSVADATRFGLAAWMAVSALSGFIALSLEIVWFRVLGVILKSNAFTFAHLLTVYLAGLGAGALIASRGVRTRQPGPLFFLLQAAIPVYATLAMAALVASVDRVEWAGPLWRYLAAYEPLTRADLGLSGGSSTGGTHGLTTFIATYLALPILLIGPPTVLMGLSFGLLQRAVQTDVHLIGRRVGWLQAANVVGATFGAVLTGLLLLERLGSVGTLRFLACMSVVYLGLYAWSAPSGARWRLSVGGSLVALTLAALPTPATFWARLHGATPAGILQREDGSGLSLLKGVGTARTTVYANGLGQSVLPYGGTHTALGALPVLLHPKPLTIAVIGLGSGDTVFAAGGRRETTTIDTIEIIAAQFATLHELTRHTYYPALQMLLSDTRVHFHFTDGRAFVRKNGRRYDIIEADALRPTSGFAGNLYSVEYFAMLREHLEPGGFAVSWMPTARVRNSMAHAFPYVTAFGDVAVGSSAPIDANLTRVRQRLSEPFTARYFKDGGVDIARVLEPYVVATPFVVGPALDRAQLSDVNRDLFPKDEFALPYTQQRVAKP